MPFLSVAAVRNRMTLHHLPYYIDDSGAPAPVMIANGWADDLAPSDEAIRFFNRTRSRHPGTPISLFLGDFGHPRSQGKAADVQLMRQMQGSWLDYYVRGVGSPPFVGVEMLTQVCPMSAPSAGPYYADNWAWAAPGEIRASYPAEQKIAPNAGSASAQTFDPLAGPGACATVPADDQTGTATYRSAPVPAGGFTLLGSPTVLADITSPGSASQIAARLLDVDPAANTEQLVARGLWRPAISSKPVQQVFQLHPNGYRFAAGHIVKLELLPNDAPYGRASNGQAEVAVSNLNLSLPVLDQPGSLGGLVQAPGTKFVPSGDTLASDFAVAPSYARPKGATPLTLSLVPAFQQCVAPNNVHGAPLSFGSCSPPVQASQNLTIGTPDANGQPAASTGSARFATVPDNPMTPVDEADVSIGVSLTDVRRASDLTAYTGELEGRTSLRITDRASGMGSTAATVSDFSLHDTIPCAAGSVPSQGASCSLSTTVNAIVPGAVQSNRRSIWELRTVEIYDGGADGFAATTADNQLFARPGLFVP